MLEPEDKIKAVESWQNDENMHPLTCGVDSKHRPLVPKLDKDKRDVILVCLDCNYTQLWVPDVIYTAYLLPR